MAHLLLHMKADIDATSLHLIVGLDDVRIEHFPSARKKGDGWQSLHIAIERRHYRVVWIELSGPVGSYVPQHLVVEERIVLL